MYSVHKNVQILLALLKEHGIKHVVCSAGTRNIPFVFSAIRDDFFKCYSVVDERSAAFFAIGIIQVTHEPCAVVCTSGTAAANYVSAVNEAFYQHLPLVVLTSDRLRYHLNQQEDQCIPQINLFKDVVHKVVDLAPVVDEMDAWYCGRLVNEALLELDHRERGPVHINFQVDPRYPIQGGDFLLNQDVLPKVRKISRIMSDDDDSKWENLSQYLKNKKVVLFYGQNLPLKKDEIDTINDFCDKYDVVFYKEHLSNIHVKNEISSAGVLYKIDWNQMCPDIVITMGGHRMADPKYAIRNIKDKIEHWHVSPNGEIADVFMCQNKIIECKTRFFFRKMAALGNKSQHPYLDSWRNMEKNIIRKLPVSSDFEYSQVYAIKSLLERIPKNSLLHISNSNSIRIMTSFDISEFIETYGNRGTCGIDGSMSSYIANSYLTERPSFMCIGDLSFFYDMNALWNKYVNANTRIMLCNNFGGAILNWGAYKKVNLEGASVNTGAEHKTSAKGWAESRGFLYLSAKNKKELEAALPIFIQGQDDRPMLLEVFTDMSVDIAERGKIESAYSLEQPQIVKSFKSIIPQPIKKIVKSVIR